MVQENLSKERLSGEVLLEIMGGQGEIVTRTKAQCYYKNRNYYLLFEERLGEEKEKEEVTFSSRLKISDGQVTLRRSIPLKGQEKPKQVMKMVYRRQEEALQGCVVDYPTPYGRMQLEIRTDHLEIAETADEVKVKIHYRLLQNGQEVSRDQISIRACRT